MSVREPGSDTILIREMVAEDVTDILAIEGRSFICPWSGRLFGETIAFPLARNFVMCSGPDLIGYVVCYFVAGEAHILNLAIAPEWRKQGCAAHLLGFLIEALTGENALAFFLEVRESNGAAIRLYQKFGFETIGRRKNYYTETGEDALVMFLEGPASTDA